MKIGFIGLGAMGTRMAANLLKAGHDVAVWNRTAERAAPLLAAGAIAADTPRAAAAHAALVISMLRDDVASRAVWLDSVTGALPAMARDAVAVESSTLSLAWVAELASRCDEHGVAFLDAPVVGSRPQAEASQLIYLVGGEATVLSRVEPALRAMGGAVHHAGAAGAGAAVKLMVNALFGIQLAAWAELIGMLRGAGFDAARAVEIAAATPVASPAAKGAAAAMLAGQFAPLFPVELVEKDFGYALAATERSGGPLPLTDATRGVLRAAIARGFAGEHLTAVAKLYAD